MSKKILLTPKDKEYEPPLGLVVGTYFKRLGILNPAVIQEDSKIDLYSRLIYEDEEGINSCIVKNKCFFKGENIIVKRDCKGLPLEELVFQASNPQVEV